MLSNIKVKIKEFLHAIFWTVIVTVLFSAVILNILSSLGFRW